MIDIHNHILAGVDDGPKLLEESITMAKIAVEEGTTVFFATPHVGSHIELLASRQYAEKTAELQAILTERHINLQLVSGAEVYPSGDVPLWLDQEYPLTLGPAGRFILLDSPLLQIPIGLDTLVFELQSKGYTPILAHPERVDPIQQNPQLLEEIVRRGLLIQINASSLTGGQGSETRKTAVNLLNLNWVHFVASDAHSIRRRRPSLSVAHKELIELVGEKTAEDLVQNNGLRVLNGESVPTDPLPYKSDKRSWFSRLFAGNG